jgi:hypothetical protein
MMAADVARKLGKPADVSRDGMEKAESVLLVRLRTRPQ